MLNQIIMTHEGFEISDFDHRKLSQIGAQFYMRIVGYGNIPEIKEVLDNDPKNLQKKVDDLCEEKRIDLFHLHHLIDDNVKLEIFIGQNIFSPHGEYTLYINLQQRKRNGVRAKNILYDLVDEIL